VTTVFLYDDARARTFEPFASTRPISEMVAGTTLIRERWKAAVGAQDVQFLAGLRHADFDEPGAQPATGKLPPGSIVANARCVPALSSDPAKAERTAASCSLWRNGNQLAAVRAREAIDVSRFADGTLTLDELHAGTGAIGTLTGWWLNEVWDFIRLLPEQLTSDIDRLIVRDRLATGAPQHATVIGGNAIAIQPSTSGEETVIEPHVVFDTTGGPILIGPGSYVRAFTRISGPCYIGRDVHILGGDLTSCSIGDVCKARGELSNTIFLGHANKGHDGFIGHSYLGRWVNIGAGTITSNLKNTYGSVTLWTPSGVRDSGMQFLGTMFGDHVKTGIGLRLTTGTVLGAGSNVYGNMPPKVVAPFTWGDAPKYTSYRADKFVEAAARMMSRRHVTLSERAQRHLTSVHASRWTVEIESL
jgi:UDP-N-acetylglucosamine diphosphorylase/glucosamine-1-phosphate N-acetyltransferase